MTTRRKSRGYDGEQQQQQLHHHHRENTKSPTTSPKGHQSIAILASRPEAEDEKCVVSQYRTTTEQRQKLVKHLENNPKNYIPIEWVIDIADETSGWFYATAYHYDDTNNMLHVMVPDKNNPTFDGNVPLDHRTVHLIESVDGNSDALFNRIVRDSVIKVKWDVEWFEEDPESNEDMNGEVKGRWVQSSARYYIRIANQILVEDTDSEEGTRGYVMLLADMNVRLIHCHKGRGLEDFTRLVLEGIVQSAHDALHSPSSIVPPSIDDLDHGEIYGKSNKTISGKNPATIPNYYSAPLVLSPMDGHHSNHGSSEHSQSFSSQDTNQIRKLMEMSRGLKECLGDLLDERDDQSSQLQDIASSFKAFALSGDLTSGLKLVEKVDKILAKKGMSNNHTDNGSSHTDEVNYDMIADDAWKLSNKLEKGLVKYYKSQSDLLMNGGGIGNGNGSGGNTKEVDHLKRMVNKMKQEMDDREEEIRLLKSNHRIR